MKLICLTVLLVLASSVTATAQTGGVYLPRLPLDKIKLPAGFEIELVATNLAQAREMVFAEDGTLFVGSKAGNIYAVTPDKKVLTLFTGLSMPIGVEYYGHDLYFSEIPRILVSKDILKHLRDKKVKYSVVSDRIPKEEWHGWKYIRIGPDRKLYVPVGAPCNVCEIKDNFHAAILRMDLDGKNLESYATGVRNTVGFDWDPQTKELWFTDNGRDWVSDDLPPDELNHAPVKGMFFGFPYMHGTTNRDLMNWDKRPSGFSFTAPVMEFPAHITPLGMKFYTNSMFPSHYRGGIFIAQHGSWNRLHKRGYRIIFIRMEDHKPVNEEVFAEGWMEDDEYWGRPNDVCVAPDGSLFVSDDFANCIYRISYTAR
jgi:glucose/arabinose dehydrogenase